MEISDLALKRLKLYLGISAEENGSDEILTLMLTDAAFAVLSYCHVKKLVPALESVVVQIALRKVNEENGEIGTDIKMGDVSISYKSPISSGSFADTEKSVLNAYRRVIAR